MREIDALLAAGVTALEVVRRPELAAAWGEPSALAGYTVGGLAGHLLAAVARTPALLDQDPPAADAPLLDLAGFYGVNRAASPAEPAGGLHELVRAAGEKEGKAGPAAVADAFAEVMARLAERLPAEPADRRVPVLTVRGAATTLRPYLASRVIEIVVHTDDLAASVGLGDIAVPAVAADLVFDALLELARARSGDPAVLRAFTRAERSGPDTLRVL